MTSAPRTAAIPRPRSATTQETLGPQALPWARKWAADPGGLHAGTGLRILAAHGDDRDAPALLAATTRITDWRGYAPLTEGLTRIVTGTGDTTHRPALLRLLRTLLKGSPHSYERASYLGSLLTLEPADTRDFLPACLLDCEPAVRLLAARHTPLTDDTRRWLGELRVDPLERDDVRTAATLTLTVPH